VIKRIEVVERGVNNGGGNDTSSFEIDVWTDTAKLTNIIIPGFGKRCGKK